MKIFLKFIPLIYNSMQFTYVMVHQLLMKHKWFQTSLIVVTHSFKLNKKILYKLFLISI